MVAVPRRIVRSERRTTEVYFTVLAYIQAVLVLAGHFSSASVVMCEHQPLSVSAKPTLMPSLDQANIDSFPRSSKH